MADFFSSVWGVYIAVVTIVSILACAWLLFALSKKRVAGSTPQTTGHRWDGDLEELNNPLPRWWMGLFVITIVFGLGYLVVYPGLGASQGQFAWSSAGQYEDEVKQAKEVYEPLFARYLAQNLEAVAADPQARAMGERLFLTYCVQCHGSDARGSKGFPNLTDRDWLHGGDPATIKKTILGGRSGMMPPMAAMVGSSSDVENLANYVLSLSDSAHDPVKAALGKSKFTACGACHGPDGKGNQALGAPNLTDKIWLYGGSMATVLEGINKGRHNQMPSFEALLGEGKAHVLAAYVWGLSNSQAAARNTGNKSP